MVKTTDKNKIEETISELYLLDALVITGAGVRLTLPMLRSFMRDPQKTLNRVEEMVVESSRVGNNSSLARDIVESACYLLVGSKDRKWLSIDEIIKNLQKKDYTITTIDNDNV